MTPEQINQNQIIEEINLIPEDKRTELYDLIHKFRMGLERSHNDIDEIMQFAGSWLDMPEEDFSDFCEEIEQRRQASSSRRFDDETLFT
ncbi:MAG: hypothetical protein ACRC80_38670 [Waterburya sp.]